MTSKKNFSAIIYIKSIAPRAKLMISYHLKMHPIFMTSF